MIIEVNTQLLEEIPELNSNQLLFLSIVLDKNQPKYQDVHKVVELVSDEEIQYLIDQHLITSIGRDDSVTYMPTDELKQKVEPKKAYFDCDTAGFANVNKCRHFFNTKCGRSSAMAEHLIKCLDYEVSKRMREGSLSYMMTMWNWLTRSQWEAIEDEMADNEKVSVNAYGTELI